MGAFARKDRIKHREGGGFIVRSGLSLCLGAMVFLVLTAPIMTSGLVYSVYDFGVFRQVSYGALLFLTVALTYLGSKKLYLQVPLPVIVLFAWCAFSIAWSDAPRQVVPALMLMGITIWCSFNLVSALGGSRSSGIIRVVLALFLVFNVLSLVLYPDIARHHDALHRWRGIMADKNQAGAVCAITAIFWLFSVPENRKVLGYVISVVSVVFLFFTGSRTAMIMLGVGLLLGFALVAQKERLEKVFAKGENGKIMRAASIIVAIFVILPFGYFTFLSDGLLDIASHGNLFTHRDEIWRPMIQTYLDHPLVGVGFDSFWISPSKEVAANGEYNWLFTVNQGHNGYLDAAVNTGFVGFCLAILAFVSYPIFLLSKGVNPGSKASALPLTLLLFCLGSNITESGLFGRDRIWSVFTLLSVALLNASVLTQRRRSGNNARERAEVAEVRDIKPLVLR